MVFYLGLEIGSKSVDQPEQGDIGYNHVIERPTKIPVIIPATQISSNFKESTKLTVVDLGKKQDLVYSPPLPPTPGKF